MLIASNQILKLRYFNRADNPTVVERTFKIPPWGGLAMSEMSSYSAEDFLKRPGEFVQRLHESDMECRWVLWTSH